MDRHLAHPPLIEAYLEIKWNLAKSSIATARDPSYPLLAGRLYEKIKSDFQYAESLPAVSIPDDLSPWIVKQRFRKSPNGWPLVQIGPGVFSLNYALPYSWTDFEQTAQSLLPELVASAHNPGLEASELETKSVLLRYINGVPFDWSVQNGLTWMKQMLHVDVRLPKKITLVDGQQTGPGPNQISARFGHPLVKPLGTGVVAVTSGVLRGERALMWELQVNSYEGLPPYLSDINAMMDWLRAAHDVIEDWFFTMIAGDLHVQLQGGTKE